MNEHRDATHDNSIEMWDRYYAAERGAGLFDRFIHWGRETYFGALFARRVVKLGGSATSYLELGVGTAQTLSRLERMTRARCVGVEKTPRAYERGKAYAPSCEIVLGDGLALPFPDKTFDVVYSLGLHEHFEPHEQQQLLREQARVARKAVLVEVPTRTPHMTAVMWFNRRVMRKKGVWADDELFSPARFRAKYPGLPFRYFFDWASGGMTCWFALKPEDIQHWLTSRGSTDTGAGSHPSASDRDTGRSWFMGSFIVAGVVAWMPYWVWNVLSGNGGWRVPVIPPGLFDTYVYLNWIGIAVRGMETIGPLPWITWLLVGLWKVMAPWASLPELWIVSRWIGATAAAWAFATIIASWSGLSKRQSRVVACIVWFGLVFVLGMRPGVYAWYLPLGLFGMYGAIRTSRALGRDDIARSLLWTALSLIASSIYPWFLLVSGIWSASLWGAWLARKNGWTIPTFVGAGSAFVLLAAPAIAGWFLDPARAGLLGVYERNGIGFSHMPFLANTFVAVIFWILLIASLLRSGIGSMEGRLRLFEVLWLWIVLLLLWFHTPFTGLFTHNDHFIAPIALASWVTFAVVWSLFSASPCREHPSRTVRRLQYAILGMSAAVFIYILQQPLRLNPFKLDVYLIHLIHWLGLTATAYFIVANVNGWRRASRGRFVAGFALILMIAMSGLAFVGVIIRNAPALSVIMGRGEILSWIQNNVPAQDALCSDPVNAEFFAAHTGRATHVSEASLSYRVSNEIVFRELETIAGAYDVGAAGQTELYRFYSDLYRSSTCDFGRPQHVLHARILRALGYGDGDVHRIIGCPKDRIDANWARISRAIAEHRVDEPAFKALCPWVVIPKEQRPYWFLPASYREAWSNDRMSVWKNS